MILGVSTRNILMCRFMRIVTYVLSCYANNTQANSFRGLCENEIWLVSCFISHLDCWFCFIDHYFYVETVNDETRRAISYTIIFIDITLRTCTANCGCQYARDNQKRRRTTKNTDAVVRRTTIKSVPKTHLCTCIFIYSKYGQPKT